MPRFEAPAPSPVVGDGFQKPRHRNCVSPDVIRTNPVDRARVLRRAARQSTCFRHLPRAGSGPMMARSLPLRTRAIRLVIRTGCIPGRDATWSEFCDLVRMAARVTETPEGRPRGWSDAAIINSAKKITSTVFPK